MKVLVVDDEPSYCETVAALLAEWGHEVRSAGSARESIDVGTRFRPDLLLTDWMLRNHFHGLDVLEALRVIEPRTEAILMTGYPSLDVRAHARRAGVRHLLSKPFEPRQLRAALADPAGDHQPRPARIAVLEVDASGGIVFANDRARELLALTPAGPAASRLADLFPPGASPDLEHAVEGWMAVRPLAAQPTTWQLRSQPLREPGTRLVLLRGEREPWETFLAEMLLGVTEPREARWPFEGRLLLIDEEDSFRGMVASTLKRQGVPLYTASTQREALDIALGDAGIRVLLVDHDGVDDEVGMLVARMRALRPGLTVVGTSGGDRSREFARIGVDRFLLKPWRLIDLIRLISD